MSTIVIADDEPMVRRLMQAAIEPLGHTVHEAADGTTAWELISRHRPALVVLDLMMPGWSGWDVIAAVRADPALEGTRLLLVTGLAGQATEAEARDVGVDAYMAKPFSPLALQALVSDLLAGKVTRG